MRIPGHRSKKGPSAKSPPAFVIASGSEIKVVRKRDIVSTSLRYLNVNGYFVMAGRRYELLRSSEDSVTSPRPALHRVAPGSRLRIYGDSAGHALERELTYGSIRAALEKIADCS